MMSQWTKQMFMYSGFMCSCGLYEFGGIFWMTYFNPFLQAAIGLNSVDIGTVVLIAQIVDAVSNPVVGLLIENLRIPLLGNKKGCHLIGSTLIIIFFPFLWMNCWFCSSKTHSVVYYSVIAGVMNALTPFIFLPHLSMIAVLSNNEKERVLFGGISSFSKQFWGILAYMTMWILIGSDSNRESDLGQVLSSKLQIASYIVVGVGILATLYFHASVFYVKETKHDPVRSEKGRLLEDFKVLFRNHNFYILALVYFLCRSELTLYNVYQVFYFEQTLKLQKESIAYLPFIYLSVAGIGSMLVRILSKYLNPMYTFLIAMVLVILSGLGFMFQPIELGNVVIVGVVIFSLGSGVLYTLSLFYTSNLIIQLKVSDVAVWGAYNLLDRILFGILFAEIQQFRPCPDSKVCCDECSDFYRFIFGGGIIVIAVSGGVLILLHNLLIKRQQQRLLAPSDTVTPVDIEEKGSPSDLVIENQHVKEDVSSHLPPLKILPIGSNRTSKVVLTMSNANLSAT